MLVEPDTKLLAQVSQQLLLLLKAPQDPSAFWYACHDDLACGVYATNSI